MKKVLTPQLFMDSNLGALSRESEAVHLSHYESRPEICTYIDKDPFSSIKLLFINGI